jgi:hypothetical protein
MPRANTRFNFPPSLAHKTDIEFGEIFQTQTTLLFGFTNLYPFNKMLFSLICITSTEK